MARTTLQVDKEVSVNLGILAEHLDEDLTKKALVKRLVKEKMKSVGLKYQKEEEGTA